MAAGGGKRRRLRGALPGGGLAAAWLFRQCIDDPGCFAHQGARAHHGLVHVGYLKLTVGEMFENALHYLMAGAPVPQACLHNVDGAYEVLLRCMSWDGAPISFGGNDWKIVHTQCTDIVIHSLLSLLRGDAVAAHLEQVSLATLRAIQQEEGGFYNVRRDLEYGGFCATRLMACYLAHGILGRDTTPASAAGGCPAASSAPTRSW